jgi:hypothetical protein
LFELGRIRVYELFYVSAHRWLLILMSSAELLTQARKCIRAVTHTYTYTTVLVDMCATAHTSPPK